jgi:hypothetical protein
MHTKKISLLTLIQAEKQVVKLCRNCLEGRYFQPNPFSAQFAAQKITRRWVALVIIFFKDYTLTKGVYHIERALRFAKPIRRYELANLVQILLQQSLATCS